MPKKTFTPGQHDQIRAVCRAHPKATCAEVAALATRQLGEDVSASTIQQARRTLHSCSHRTECRPRVDAQRQPPAGAAGPAKAGEEAETETGTSVESLTDDDDPREMGGHNFREWVAHAGRRQTAEDRAPAFARQCARLVRAEWRLGERAAGKS